MSLKNGVALLLGQRIVNSVQVSNSKVGKTPPDLNIPCFTVGLIYYGIILSSVHLLT